MSENISVLHFIVCLKRVTAYVAWILLLLNLFLSDHALL